MCIKKQLNIKIKEMSNVINVVHDIKTSGIKMDNGK